MMSILSSVFDHALRVARAVLPPFRQKDCSCRLSRQERLGLIFSAIDRGGADCPACASWALEQDRFRTSWDAEPNERRLPC